MKNDSDHSIDIRKHDLRLIIVVSICSVSRISKSFSRLILYNKLFKNKFIIKSHLSMETRNNAIISSFGSFSCLSIVR